MRTSLRDLTRIAARPCSRREWLPPVPYAIEASDPHAKPSIASADTRVTPAPLATWVEHRTGGGASLTLDAASASVEWSPKRGRGFVACLSIGHQEDGFGDREAAMRYAERRLRWLLERSLAQLGDLRGVIA